MNVINAAKSALEAIQASRASINTEIENLSAKIETMTRNKTKLKNAAISLNDYGDYLLAEIKNRGEKYADSWLSSRKSKPGAGNRIEHSTMRWPDFEEREVNSLLSEVLSADSTGDALCFLFPDMLHSRLMDCLRERQSARWTEAGTTGLAERRAAIQALEAEEDELKRQRDELFMQLNDINDALRVR